MIILDGKCKFWRWDFFETVRRSTNPEQLEGLADIVERLSERNPILSDAFEQRSAREPPT